MAEARHQHRPRLHGRPTSPCSMPRLRHGLRVMVGAAVDPAHRVSRRSARWRAASGARPPRPSARSASHPAALLFAVGNEIPPGSRALARHGSRRALPAQPVRVVQAGGARRARSPTSTSRRPSTSTSTFFDVRASTSTCIARPICARTSRGCSTPPATSRSLLAEAGADSIREGLDGQARDHRDAHPRGIRRRRRRRRGLRLDRRVVARRQHGRGLGVRAGRRERQPEAGAGRCREGVRGGAVPAASVRDAGPGCRWWSALTTRPTPSTTA